MPWEAFFLGLSSGTYCAVACAPVALPFLSSRERAAKPYGTNALLIGLFLAGRLVGYIGVGAALGAVGAYALSYVDPAFSRTMSRIAYALSGALMIVAGLAEGFPRARACEAARRIWRPKMGAFLFGLFTGASICPPFFAAAARVFAGSDASGASGTWAALSGAAYFAFFFVGASVWLLPLLALPAVLRRSDVLRFIARSAMTMIGVYFLLVIGLLGAT
jgi:sulfite exporter TauE/SafE